MMGNGALEGVVSTGRITAVGMDVVPTQAVRAKNNTIREDRLMNRRNSILLVVPGSPGSALS
jgi:hypothetical protein